MIQKTLTLGSLFDGSGGFPLGGILAGIEPVSMSIPLIAGYAAVYPKVTKTKTEYRGECAGEGRSRLSSFFGLL